MGKSIGVDELPASAVQQNSAPRSSAVNNNESETILFLTKHKTVYFIQYILQIMQLTENLSSPPILLLATEPK